MKRNDLRGPAILDELTRLGFPAADEFRKRVIAEAERAQKVAEERRLASEQEEARKQAYEEYEASYFSDLDRRWNQPATRKVLIHLIIAFVLDKRWSIAYIARMGEGVSTKCPITGHTLRGFTFAGEDLDDVGVLSSGSRTPLSLLGYRTLYSWFSGKVKNMDREAVKLMRGGDK